MEQKYSSQNTSINKNKLPAVFSKVDWERHIYTKNLDYGGGKYDNATKYLKQFHIDNYIYDPYNRSAEHNAKIICHYGDFDTATCSNVLNVIKEYSIRRQVLKDIYNFLKPDGVLYITIYPGDRSRVGRETKNDCWQNNMILQDYLIEVVQVFSCAKVKSGMIIAYK